MKQRNSGALRVWIQTGNQEDNSFRATWAIISNQFFLFSVGVITVTVMIYFKLTQIWWMWAVASSTTGLAVATILLRRRARGKLLISKCQTQKCNRFLYAAAWIANRYLNHIDLEAERSQDDRTVSIALYRHLGEAFIAIGLYDETGQAKIKAFTGNEFLQIKLIEYYTDFILAAGIGYVLIEPSANLIAKINSVDERIISLALRDIGLINWTVERVSYDDDIVLFVIKDETICRAYDFTVGE